MQKKSFFIIEKIQKYRKCPSLDCVCVCVCVCGAMGRVCVAIGRRTAA